MMCLSPISISRPGGNGSRDRITVPCGKCAACLNRKRQEWSFRLEQELKHSNNAYFITLTYDDDNLYYNDFGFPSVNKRDIQLFLKRLRKIHGFRFYIVAEYGTKTYRPHYHMLLFSFLDDINAVNDSINRTWNKGHVVIGTVTPASINYCAKYCITKPLEVQNRDPVFSLMSRKPGIGYEYKEKMQQWHEKDNTRFYAVKEDGIKVPLPRYLRDKIYDKAVIEERSAKIQNVEFEKLTREEFEKKNPGQNYFKYLLDIRQDYARRLKQTIDKSSKL